MLVRGLIEALGVPLVTVPSSCKPTQIDNLYGPELGCSPDIGVELRWIDNSPTVCWNPRFGDWAKSLESVLHEALHAVVGPSSLDDELTLMAYQAALISCCSGAEYSSLRESFSCYMIDWQHPETGEDNNDVGSDDVVFESRAWQEAREAAVEAGLLVVRHRRHVPVFGLGPHPEWAAWAHKSLPRRSPP